MSPADWAGIANAGAAWLALILAGISLYKTHESHKRQNELAATTEQLNRLLIKRETQVGLDSRRADLSASLIDVGGGCHRLRVFNQGQGTALNVRLIDLEESGSILIEDELKRTFPLRILEQHQSVEIIAAICLDSPLRCHIRLLWDDETGSDHEKELTLSL